MVLTSHPFLLHISPSNFLPHAALLWHGNVYLSLITFLWGIFLHSITFLWTIFWRLTTLLWTNFFEPKNPKHEIYTKYRRRKHERYTQFCVFFVQTEDKVIERKQPVDLWKISGLNWTTETKGAKWRFEIKGSKRAFGLVENQPYHFVTRWHEVINFIAGCDEVALKNATS